MASNSSEFPFPWRAAGRPSSGRSARRTCIIAELSGNHNGCKERALELVRAAHAAGADAVKLQTYTADTITMDCDSPCFRIQGGPWHGRKLHDLYGEASTPWAWHADLVAEADRLGLPWFSTPFDATAVDFLESLGCPLYKIASFEVVDVPLLRKIAATGRPVILSVGMSTLEEVDLAVETLKDAGCPQLALLHCISAYPAPAGEMRLGNMEVLRHRYGCAVGLSDHSLGHTAAIAAVVLGAQAIEKHLCLRRTEGGPDAAFSLEPAEFSSMVGAIRDAEAMVAAPAAFGPQGDESGNIAFRKSIFAARDIPEGKKIEADDIRVIRPGHGLAPKHLPAIIGMTARVTIGRGTPLAWNLLSGEAEHL